MSQIATPPGAVAALSGPTGAEIWVPPRLRAVSDISVPAPTILTRKNGFLIRLAESVRRAKQRVDPYLKVRKEGIDNLVGPRYGPGRGKRRQPLPTVMSYTAIMQPLITPQRVACEVSTEVVDLRWKARKLEAIVNRTLEETGFIEAVSECVIDALFGWGVMKVGLEAVIPGGRVDFENWRQDPGRFFGCRVSPLQFYFDDTCTAFRAAKWQGHAEWVEDDIAMESYPDARDILEGMGTDKRRTRESAGAGDGGEALYPEYELLHVHLKREGVVLTIPADPDKVRTRPVAEKEYHGPEGGEYQMLGYLWPPDSPFPVNVVDQTLDLHDAVNAIMRKIVRQVARLKRVLLYATGKDKEAGMVAAADDGGTVAVEDPKKYAEVTLGGVEAQLTGLLSTLQGTLNYYGGNPESVGGLASKAGTLGQQVMEFQNATTSLGRMRTATMAMCDWACKSAAWYAVTNPSPDPVDIAIPVDGQPQGQAEKWTVVDRGSLQAEFERLAIETNAYAATLAGPESEYRVMKELLAEIVMPLLPGAAAQGVYVDVAAAVNRIARLRGLHELSDWFKTGPPMVLPGAPSVARPVGTPSAPRQTGRPSEPAAPQGGEPSTRMTPGAAAFGENA